MLPKSSVHVKICDGETKWIHFLIQDNDLLNKYNTIWGKFRAGIKKEFDNEPVCNKKFLKTKIKSYGDETTDFHDKDISKVDSNHICLAVIILNSALDKDGNYFPQLFFKKV